MPRRGARHASHLRWLAEAYDGVAMRPLSWMLALPPAFALMLGACSSGSSPALPEDLTADDLVRQAVEAMEGLGSMRAELTQSGDERPFLLIVDVVGDDFRTDFTSTGEGRADGDDGLEFLTLGKYVFIREQSGTWVRQERPDYVPTMVYSTMLHFETYPLAALEYATDLTMPVETRDGLIHVSGRVNHLQALFEHQARLSPKVFGSIGECDSDPDVDLDGDGIVTYEEVFADLIDHVEIESVPLSDIEAWIRVEDRLVERIELTPPPTLEGRAELGTFDGSFRARYSGFNSTTLVEPTSFVEEFESGEDDLLSDFEEMPPTPEGLEALSKHLTILGGGVAGFSTSSVTLPLVERIDNADSVGFYSFVDDQWVKLDISVRVRDGGCTVEARLGDVIPENIGVLREE